MRIYTAPAVKDTSRFTYTPRAPNNIHRDSPSWITALRERRKVEEKKNRHRLLVIVTRVLQLQSVAQSEPFATSFTTKLSERQSMREREKDTGDKRADQAGHSTVAAAAAFGRARGLAGMRGSTSPRRAAAAASAETHAQRSRRRRRAPRGATVHPSSPPPHSLSLLGYIPLAAQVILCVYMCVQVSRVCGGAGVYTFVSRSLLQRGRSLRTERSWAHVYIDAGEHTADGRIVKSFFPRFVYALYNTEYNTPLFFSCCI